MRLPLIAILVAVIVSLLSVDAFTPDGEINWQYCERESPVASSVPDSALKRPDQLETASALSPFLYSIAQDYVEWLGDLWHASSELGNEFTVNYGTNMKSSTSSITVDQIVHGLNSHSDLKDPELVHVFDWIDQYVPVKHWATALKAKYFNALLQNRRRSIRNLLRPSWQPSIDMLKSLKGSGPIHSTTATAVQNSEPFGGIQCAKVHVPLLWNKTSDSRFIHYHVKRFLVPDPSRRKGILWLIQGGPGMDGSVFNTLAPFLMKEFDNEYDLYVSDHRGVGRSTILECSSGQVADRYACYNAVKELWGSDGLAGFSTDGSAMDIIHVSRLIKKAEGGKVILFGASYGTYVVNRILTLAEKGLIDMAIVDGLVPPGFDFLNWDEATDTTGRRLLSKCIESEFCSLKFGTDYQSTLEQALEAMYDREAEKGKSCGVFQLPKVGLMRLLSLLLQAGYERDAILPLVYRSRRCNEADKIAINNFFLGFRSALLLLETTAPKRFAAGEHVLDRITRQTVDFELSRLMMQSRVHEWDAVNEPTYQMSLELSFNIKAAELSGAPYWPSRSTLLEKYYDSNRLFGNGASVIELDNYSPRIEGGVYDTRNRNIWATNYTGPMLMMSGDLDLQTPLEEAHRWYRMYQNPDRYPNHHFVVFPGAHHGTFLTAVSMDDTYSCGVRVMASFIKSEGKTISDRCFEDDMHQTYPFATTRSQAIRQLFSNDIWDGRPADALASIQAFVTLIVVAVVLPLCICPCLCCVCIVCCVHCAKKKRHKMPAKVTNTNMNFGLLEQDGIGVSNI